MEYTYTILFKPTGQMYHGSRTTASADPDELLKPNGYHTSSNTVKSLINEYGLDNFEIVNITLYPNGGAFIAEREFLINNKCDASPIWLNKSKSCLPHSSPEFKEKLIEKYGTSNCWEIPEWRKKLQHAMKISQNSEETRAKIMSVWEDKGYGINPFCDDGIKNKIKSTMIERYGVDHPSKSEPIIQKKADLYKEKTGYEHQFLNPSVRESIRQTMNERYGVSNASNVPEIRQRAKNTCLEKYGSESPLSNIDIQNKTKSTLLSKYGVDNIAKIPYTCPHCGKSGKGKHNANRWHFDNCKEQK